MLPEMSALIGAKIVEPRQSEEEEFGDLRSNTNMKMMVCSEQKLRITVSNYSTKVWVFIFKTDCVLANYVCLKSAGCRGHLKQAVFQKFNCRCSFRQCFLQDY